MKYLKCVRNTVWILTRVIVYTLMPRTNERTSWHEASRDGFDDEDDDGGEHRQVFSWVYNQSSWLVWFYLVKQDNKQLSLLSAWWEIHPCKVMFAWLKFGLFPVSSSCRVMVFVFTHQSPSTKSFLHLSCDKVEKNQQTLPTSFFVMLFHIFCHRFFF